MVTTKTLAVPTATGSLTPQPSRLVLRELTCAFGSFAAVDRVSLAVAPGEFVSLLGPSGCGKTTMLRAIAGFIEPISGSIEMDGKIISAPRSVLPPERRRMSMIFQSYAVWPNMTVAQNVAFGLKLRRLEREVIRQRLARILDVVQLTQFAERYPSELSGGQQQRVALARAIVIDPEVLLLDEPLSNLDANLREEMRFEIRRLHDEFGYTTVYVTHDQAEAMVTSDRIAVMNAGSPGTDRQPGRDLCAPPHAFRRRLPGTHQFPGSHLGGSGAPVRRVCGAKQPPEPARRLRLAAAVLVKATGHVD